MTHWSSTPPSHLLFILSTISCWYWPYLDTMTMPLTMLTPSWYSIIRYTTLDSISTSFYHHHPIHINISPNIESIDFTYSMVPCFYLITCLLTNWNWWIQVSAPIRSWIQLAPLACSDMVVTVSCGTSILMWRKVYIPLGIPHDTYLVLVTNFVLSYIIDQPWATTSSTENPSTPVWGGLIWARPE